MVFIKICQYIMQMNYIRLKIGANFHYNVTILRFGQLITQIK